MLAPGEMIAANGGRYHVQRYGTGGKTLLLETGLTMMSGCWGWLAPALAEAHRVIAYDRAGLGWSEDREGLRSGAEIAKELDGLLTAMQVKGPVVLVGHSMGSIFNRAFLQLDPARVAAVVWLDPTHPDQLTRSRRMRTFLFLLEFAHLLAARNLPSVTLRMVAHLKGLPEKDYRAVEYFLKNPLHVRTSAREARAWKLSAEHVREATVGDLPLLIVSAQKNALRNWTQYQQELAQQSGRTRHVTFTDMSHLSMLANREHVARVAAEINGFLAKLKL
jgi:pimeloyl-ACP methyl ester carboxylesterase